MLVIVADQKQLSHISFENIQPNFVSNKLYIEQVIIFWFAKTLKAKNIEKNIRFFLLDIFVADNANVLETFMQIFFTIKYWMSHHFFQSGTRWATSTTSGTTASTPFRSRPTSRCRSSKWWDIGRKQSKQVCQQVQQLTI